MGAAEDELNEAVRAARTATRELLSLLTAHQMVPGLLNLRLAPAWPMPVLAAYVHWRNRIDDIARVLARRRGIMPGAEAGRGGTGGEGKALLIRAYVLALDLDDPEMSG